MYIYIYNYIYYMCIYIYYILGFSMILRLKSPVFIYIYIWRNLQKMMPKLFWCWVGGGLERYVMRWGLWRVSHGMAYIYISAVVARCPSGPRLLSSVNVAPLVLGSRQPPSSNACDWLGLRIPQSGIAKTFAKRLQLFNQHVYMHCYCY